MTRGFLRILEVLFLVAVIQATMRAQEPASGSTQAQATAPQSEAVQLIPAATQSEIECSGFISGSSISADAYVSDGADNDFQQPFRQFTPGDFVYLRGQKQERVARGTEYRLVRPATATMLGGQELPLFGRATWYSGQARATHSLGQVYEDVGRAKVTALSPQGLVAEVTFSCGAVTPNDLAIPFHAREIPAYDPSVHSDHFTPLREGQRKGAITAAAGNAGALGNGSLVYLNLGDTDGARTGQRYRIFHIYRNILGAGLRSLPITPTETVGELVILFTQEKSSVAVVIFGLRDLALGDGIELE